MLSLLPIFLSLLSQTRAQSAQHSLYRDLLENYNPLFIPIVSSNNTNITEQVQRVYIEANLQKIIDVEPRKVREGGGGGGGGGGGVTECCRESWPAWSGWTWPGRTTTSSGTQQTTAVWPDWSCRPARSGPRTFSSSMTWRVISLTISSATPLSSWSPVRATCAGSLPSWSSKSSLHLLQAHVDCRTMCDMTGKTTEAQSCELKFGSWVYNAHQLDLINVSQ